MEPFCVIDFLNPFMPDVEIWSNAARLLKQRREHRKAFKNMFGNFSIMDGMVE